MVQFLALGKFEWFNLADNKTLVTLTQWGDLNQPQGFLFKNFKCFPEVKLAIPNGSSAFVLEALKNKYIRLKSDGIKCRAAT
jgi:hypothetical protein